MHLSGIDLNLVVVLQALIETRSVSKAARKVGLSQSATSHALARLRTIVGDPLVVRSGRGIALTPRALQMGASLASGLAQIERGLFLRQDFDPSREARRFRVSSGDFGELLMIPPLIHYLAEKAPGVDVWFKRGGESPFDDVVRGDIDVMINLAPRSTEALHGLRYAPLLRDHFVSIVRKGHPLTRTRMTTERFSGAKHLFVAPGGQPGGPVDDALAKLGKSRRITVAVPHFLVAPHVVAQSDLVLTIGSRLAYAFAHILPLTILKTPLTLPDFELGAYWHARHDDDLAHEFLRKSLGFVASQLPKAYKESTARSARK